jgi:type IV pilus assembly protein PilN
MRNINLLPWREERRREAQRNFIILLVASALAAAACVFLVSRYYESRIDYQGDRNNYLRTEIGKLDRQIARIEELDETRSRLIERKRVIEELQANRTLMVRLFQELVETVPSGIRLLNARQLEDQITISGISQSNARVSTYLRNIEAASVMHDPQLRIIEADAGSTTAEMPFGFTIVASVGPRPEEDGTQETGMEATQ